MGPTNRRSPPSSQNQPASELREGVDYTMENGLMVFTRAYHLKRGYCCNSGCRNCPYLHGEKGKKAEPT